MAQTGYTPILIYSSSTGGNAPAAGNLINSTLGSELAINIFDGKLFYKDSGGSVQVIAWKTTPTSAGGTGLSSYTAGDTVYYASGTAFTRLSIGANKTIMTSTGTAPQWSTSLDTTQGGTGVTSYTAGDLLYYATGTTFTKLAIGANTTILSSTGSAPSWVAQSTLSVGSATNATNTAITDDTSTNATMYPTWVTANTGNLPQKVTSTKLTFNPFTGTLSTTILQTTGNASVAGTSVNLSSSSNALTINTATAANYSAIELASGGALNWYVNSNNAAVYETISGTRPKIYQMNGAEVLRQLSTGAISFGSTGTAYGTSGQVLTSAGNAVPVWKDAPGSGPAFSVYRNTNQTITSGVYTKVQLDTETFDTNNNFDSSTNYRFTPTVAGYYQINGKISAGGSTGATSMASAIYKNGSVYKYGPYVQATSSESNVQDVIYFNGSTDYVELYVYITATTTAGIGGGSSATYFSGALVRAA